MKIGIIGVSGYGGSELLRLCGGHPTFEIAYVGGDSTAGQSLAHRFPALVGHPAGRLQIQPFVPENISGLDLLFASLPTGRSREPLGRVGKNIRIVDIGGDHRFAEGWESGKVSESEIESSREKGIEHGRVEISKTDRSPPPRKRLKHD